MYKIDRRGEGVQKSYTRTDPILVVTTWNIGDILENAFGPPPRPTVERADILRKDIIGHVVVAPDPLPVLAAAAPGPEITIR